MELILGCTGLEHLKKLDNVFKKRSEFFDVSALNVQRTMMTKDENERLNKLLTQYIVQLSPYAQHFACHQVLEWLIYKYQVWLISYLYLGSCYRYFDSFGSGVFITLIALAVVYLFYFRFMHTMRKPLLLHSCLSTKRISMAVCCPFSNSISNLRQISVS